jgi:hypothetical protein
MRPHFYSSEQTHGQKFGDSRVQACTGRRDDPRLSCCSRSTNDGNHAIVDHHKHRDEPTISAWTAPPIKSWSGMAAAVWWQSMPELSRGSPTFRCRFIRKGFNSIPQVVGSSSISPSHIRSQLWIADQESWRQPGPSRTFVARQPCVPKRSTDCT